MSDPENVTVVKHRPYCTNHGITSSIRNGQHDAYYCVECNRWLESVCGDPECFYCRDRPEKPMERR